eukprot:Trichotokara_eunicae@DN2685_c0_g1_i1.p1
MKQEDWRQEILAVERNDEIMLKENPERWVMFPIKFDTIWAHYKRIEANFWTSEDYGRKLETEVSNFENKKGKSLKLDNKKFEEYVKKVLCYHTIKSGKIFEEFTDTSARFLAQVQVPEARAFIGFQMVFEIFQIELLSTAFRKIVPDSMKQEEMAEKKKKKKKKKKYSALI